MWSKITFLLLFIAISAKAEVPLEIQKVTHNIYAVVGELGQRSPDNYANNATFGVVVTEEGVVLIDSGGSYKGAQQLDNALKKITDKPVKIVINTGGQDHRWLGNGYFKAKGAHIITSKAASQDHRDRTNEQFNRLDQLLGKTLEETKEVYADETFEESKTLDFGGVTFKLFHAGPAHTIGDIFVWLPKYSVMFSGDIVFTGRALGIGPAKNTLSWISVFEKMMSHKPKHIIPGHGHVSTPSQAKQDTFDYLTFLRQEVGKIIEDGGDMQDAININQAPFQYLKLFDLIAKRNAQAVFSQMEFE